MKGVGLEFLNAVLHVLLVVHDEVFSPRLDDITGFVHCSFLGSSFFLRFQLYLALTNSKLYALCA
jgi:hypothetical protein